jgi:hypothetical protein
MAIFLYLFREHNLAIVVGLGAVIYAASLVVLRFFRNSDWILFKSALSLKPVATHPTAEASGHAPEGKQ